MKKGSKYYPLFLHLRGREETTVVLEIAAIETLIKGKLPGSARRQAGWWSNRRRGAVQAQAWMAAGFHVTAVDLNEAKITFDRPKLVYEVQQVDNQVRWTGELVHGLRRHMKLTQGELAATLGVRQQTVSEWERGVYAPSRATSKYLSLVAEKAGFNYQIKTSQK